MIEIHIRAKRIYQIPGVGQDLTPAELEVALAAEKLARETPSPGSK